MTQAIKVNLRVSSFLFGISLPLVSAKLILSKPKLILYSFIPLVITILFYYYGISSIYSYVTQSLSHGFLERGFDPNGWTAKMILVISKVFLFLVSAFTFSFANGIFTCPFNDFLAEQAEAYAQPPLKKIILSSRTRLKLISLDLIKMMVAALLYFLTLLISWIPGINLLSLMATFLLISFQYISYPQSRRKEGVLQSLLFLKSHFYSCLGFGASLSFLFTLPFFSIFATPIAVVGGTLLFAHVTPTEGIKIYSQRNPTFTDKSFD